ncbi:triose-phosphate isomerase [Nitrososphaera viennensis]|uniref:Triose-phosphate isomerase n=2 Tax=Nitrososphaera viennensis TaxID=1034015 RepID=A0A060HJH7_9ARCH|nr:triose-phosphate isomerase [Nitrososphaera viennensis]AIC15683.1 triosephosphate isomerase [Nitrososphaera viennensis EN76]UVS70556.1 triose-phosphate isomerase [Nitrososphaera viennensis]
MKLLNRPLIINFKNYGEASSAEKTLELARAAQEVARKLEVEVVLAPPQPSLALVCKNVDIPVISQHVDDAQEGSTTGFFVPEIAKSYGASGSLINHSEHRIEIGVIASLAKKLRALKMTSIVCARTPDEVTRISEMEPDFIAIEPPELIGSGRAVSKENPAIITDSIKAAGGKSKVICGAGITDRDDVAKAVELGSYGILVASGIIKAKSWPDKIAELAQGMKKISS